MISQRDAVVRRKDALEEGVRQDNVVDIPHERVLKEVLVNEEEERQIDLFSRQKFLLLEAETLDLGKISRRLVQTSSAPPPPLINQVVH